MKSVVVLENIRSVYNVWNILRTADALWRDVVFSGYTATPDSNPRVAKTSLGAENSVTRRQLGEPNEAVKVLRAEWYYIIAAEIAQGAEALDIFSQNHDRKKPLAVVFGNEVTWVLEETLQTVDHIVFVSMKGEKESLNVGQTSAIFMRELRQSL